MVVIGLGSGRSGTASLSNLINEQPDSVCFHELNPACVKFEGTPQPVLNTVREFRAIVEGGDPRMLSVDFTRPVAERRYRDLLQMSKVRVIGDIAHYYLRYVEDIHRADPQVRFVCLVRDREATIRSWIGKMAIRRWPSRWVADRISSLIMRAPFHRARNHWIEHDGSRWMPDPVWDKCFPKYPANGLREALEQYYDEYYRRAAVLAERLPERFMVVRTESLGADAGQGAILDFLGYPPDGRVVANAHVHRSDAD
jgi:hypothetical protein